MTTGPQNCRSPVVERDLGGDQRACEWDASPAVQVGTWRGEAYSHSREARQRRKAASDLAESCRSNGISGLPQRKAPALFSQSWENYRLAAELSGENLRCAISLLGWPSGYSASRQPRRSTAPGASSRRPSL